MICYILFYCQGFFMDDFKKILLRLKNELSVETDNEVAELLGMTPAAFRTRKNRGTFPVHQLTEFVFSHPELNLNLDYLLDGERKIKNQDKLEITVNPNEIDEFDEDMNLGKLSSTEVLLIKYFRKSGQKGKSITLRIAKMEAVLSNYDL